MKELTSDHLLDPESIAGLLRQAPEFGVLSIYVNADVGGDPGLQATTIDETGARVTPVEGAARGALADAEGIAARLRW